MATRVNGVVDRVEGDVAVVVYKDPGSGEINEVYVDQKKLKRITLQEGEDVTVEISSMMVEPLTPRLKIENKKITDYKLFLQEHSRPPSRGGNTKALHAHYLEIEGEKYSFLALGSQQWVFKSDTVSFEYIVKDGIYKNIIKATLVTVDHSGKIIVRGNRDFKNKLRTAATRMPVSRREQRD